MRADNILYIDTAVEKFILLEVVIRIRLAADPVVVLLRKEAGSPQDETRQRKFSMKELAQIFRRQFCDAINVFGNRNDILCDPRGRLSGRRSQRGAKSACRACVDENAHAGGNGAFEQIQGPGNVDVYEFL